MNIICTEHVYASGLHARLVELNRGDDQVNILAVVPLRYAWDANYLRMIEVLLIYRRQDT